MILSSLSQALPVSSGVATSTTAFDSIWEAAEGTIPTNWTWSAKGDDLKIQRINLSDLFVQLILNKDDATTGNPGNYAIEGVGPTTVPLDSYAAYYIDGTLLELYDRNSPAVFQYGEILHRSKSFVFVLGSWQGEKFLGKGMSRLTPVDLQRAADAFTDSKTNNCAANSGVTTWTVYYSMIGFMSNYVNWCEAGCQGCTAFGNKNPSGTYGSALNGQQSVFGSQAYLNAKTTALICQQAN
jgi:hypothetical protein